MHVSRLLHGVVPAAVAAAVVAGCGRNPGWRTLPEAAFERGGVTFDFKAASDRSFAPPDPSSPRNLASNPENVKGRGFVKYIRLCDDRGGTYRLSFAYSHEGRDGAACYIRHYRLDGGQMVRTPKPVQVIKLADGGFLRDFTLPAGVDLLGVEWRAPDLSKLDIRDLSLVKQVAAAPYEAFLMPLGHLDGTFCIPRGQCGTVALAWRRTDSSLKDAWNRFEYRVKLPPGVDFIDVSAMADAKSVSRRRCESGATSVSFRPALRINAPGNVVTIHNSFGLLVSTSRPEGEIGEGTLEVWHDGRPVSGVSKVVFRSVAPIRALMPKRYFNGIDSPENMIWFHKPESNAMFARFMAEAGVGCVLSDSDVRLRSIWRTNGIAKILVQSKWFANGYRIGSHFGQRPPEDRYVSWQARTNCFTYYYATAACPKAIYEERPFFVTNTLPEIARLVEGSDGLWANWEPYHFDGVGCMCGKCRDGFAAFAGIDEKALAADWPAGLGQPRYKKKLCEYRSVEHAKLVRTIDRHVRTLTGGETSMGFVPGVAWSHMSSGPGREKSAEYDERRYAGSLKWIEPWGPYAFWDATARYVPDKRKQMMHFFSARDVRQQIDSDFSPRSRPKIMAFPHGVQGGSWLTQPEHLEMALDSFFFNGWDASMVYFFPAGYDARHWAAFASATSRAARYERYMGDGSAPLPSRIEVLSPYAAPCARVSAFLPDVAGASALQCVTRSCSGCAMAAIFNFWDEGEVFFSLSTDLPPGRYAIVDEDGCVRMKDASHPFWNASEIASGVRLRTAAARTRVFEFVPECAAGNLDAKSGFTDAAFDLEMEKARPRLEPAASRDAEEEKRKSPPKEDGMAVI